MLMEETMIPTEIHHVGVDSRYRDTKKYPHSYEYTVPFQDVYKNVVSVELVFAVYEKVATDLYCNIYIEELTPNLKSNSNIIEGSFTQLPMVNNINTYDRGQYRSIKLFDKPLSKLSKLTIRFLKPDGTPYMIRDHFLRFEVTCLKINSTVEWKNLEMIANSASMFQAVSWDPEKVIGLPPGYKWNDLRDIFTKKAKAAKDKDPTRYEELKRAFKELSKRFVNESDQ